MAPWRSAFDRRTQQHAARWRRAIGACHPQAGRQEVAVAAQAAIGLLHSVVFWSPAALRASDLVDRLCTIVLAGIATLDDATPA